MSHPRGSVQGSGILTAGGGNVKQERLLRWRGEGGICYSVPTTIGFGDGTLVNGEKRRVTEPTRLRRHPTVGEFFAGIGLVGIALEQEGCRVVFANDIDPMKQRLFSENCDPRVLVPGDIRDITGSDIPDIDIATASFPCTDLSLAGNRAGLTGRQSGMFWEFARVLDEMGLRRPPVVLLENVVGFSSSNGRRDLKSAMKRLNSLGYWCDMLVADARWFVPQSRPRVFIVGSQAELLHPNGWTCNDEIRPPWFATFVRHNPDLMMHALPLAKPAETRSPVSSVVERMSAGDARWWGHERLDRFLNSLSPVQSERLERLRKGSVLKWRTAYRRTRQGRPVWEIRADEIAGCLRTARGGSSKQAVVQAGRGQVRVRWMTPLEYARLQGAPDFKFESANESAAYFGFGDAVCVPVVAWIAREYLIPLVKGEATGTLEVAANA